MYHAPYINYVVRWKLLSDHPVLEMSFFRKIISILINLNFNYSAYHVFNLIIFKQLTAIVYTQ